MDRRAQSFAPFLWLPEWQVAYPKATTWIAPGIHLPAGPEDSVHLLQSHEGHPWDTELKTLPIAGRYMTEVEFFHSSSRTLLLTDLIENFERHKLGFGLMRFLAFTGGAMDPHGSMPRDMRFTFQKSSLRQAVETMIGWDPERIIISHGRWYQSDGAKELRRAFRWLLR